ncbi:exosortase Y-associated Wzy-like protein [Pedobacter sp. B4-66]|uniref:exosortase Y-associated Wzy-like protein n=1 Tax=Pedobacter sp. B4-66 TaxID=2817280 RepID=UPI001BDA6633|nr:hypothetical protein [Pedobacter sp. B4-66]
MPLILAEITGFYPALSYSIAWVGSSLIFYLTLFSPFRYLSHDLPLQYQIMRPIILIQLIFAGFMCCTSIFYFTDHFDSESLSNIAKCQRLALLAHAAIVTGMILLTKPLPIIKYKLISSEGLLYKLCIICYVISSILNYAPALIQFKHSLLFISITSSAYLLIKGMINCLPIPLIFGGISFGLNILNSTLTGYKESIIINVLLLGFLAFPYYKKTILTLAIPCIYLLMYALPTFTSVIRAQSWLSGKPKELARQEAYQTFFDENKEDLINTTNKEFLTNRLSEIGMFTQYVKQVPNQHPYYGLEILTNSLLALIPRAFWEEKPDTEKVAMERVYVLNVANRLSNVSAKTRPVVDGYLSGGAFGVFIVMLTYGLTTQWLCNTAEKLFGGYQLGCIIMFNSIFQQLWRGNTFEFLLNNILYGYVLMLIIFWTMRITKLLNPITDEDYTY